jgi:hypothetical protein
MEKTTFLHSTFLTKYHSGDQIKKTVMGKGCSMYGGEERCIQAEGRRLRHI